LIIIMSFTAEDRKAAEELVRKALMVDRNNDSQARLQAAGIILLWDALQDLDGSMIEVIKKLDKIHERLDVMTLKP